MQLSLTPSKGASVVADVITSWGLAIDVDIQNNTLTLSTTPIKDWRVIHFHSRARSAKQHAE